MSKKALKATPPAAEQAATKKPTLIMALTVKAGRKAGVYIEADVKGEVVYMPLTVEGARKIASDLEEAAACVERMAPADKHLH